jgi:dipeptidyl aminopeptidase/acylaminoacyl peptidase
MHLVTMHSPVTGALQAVAFNDLQVEWQTIDAAVAADFEAIATALPGELFTITSRDRHDRIWIVESSSPQNPGRCHLYRRDTGQLESLFEVRPNLTAFVLAAMQPVRFKARDGLSIPAYLTLPPGAGGKNLPLVLLVHGGPWHRDSWGYDPEVQLLANRGYAVLQVEFRGSTGFGKKHLNAGNGEWGRAMQNDLTDAVRWAVGRRIADPKRVAIMGGSYGGYAVLAGLAFTPDLYVCGVDVVGPSNVATTLASIPPYWKPVKKRWVRRVGDAENDAALNARISPLHHVTAIRAPLLIGHGAHDPRVKQAESDQVVKALRERNLPVTYIVFPDEGHGFGRKENNLDFYGRVEEFLAKYLGGRAEPWVKVDGSSAEVR